MDLGGGVIKDATATPETVRQGDIFYNNDGRQVGSNPDVKKTITKIFSYNGPTSGITYNKNPEPTFDYTGLAYRSSVSNSTTSDGKYVIEELRTYYTTGETSIVKSTNISGIWFSSTDQKAMVIFYEESVGIPVNAVSALTIGDKNYIFDSLFSSTCDYGILDMNGSIGSGSIRSSSSSYTVLIYPVVQITNKIITRIRLGASFSVYGIKNGETMQDTFSLNSMAGPIKPVTIIYQE